MQRFRRRFWTWLITISALLVLAAAGVSGLFQIAVQAVPGYRTDVEQYVQKAAGRPIRIGAIDLKWHYYYPEIELRDVALLSDEGDVLLSAQELHLGFSLLRAIRMDFTPNRLELQELTLDLRLTRDGKLLVEGMEDESGSGDSTDALRQLSQQFKELRLVRCRLNMRDERRREVYSFGITDAEIDRGLLRTQLTAELVLPATFGDTAHLEASMAGDPLDPSSWSGEWRADLAGLSAGPWLKPFLAPAAAIELTAADTRVQGKLEKGQWTSLRADLTSGPVTAHRGRRKAGFQSLAARVDVAFKPDGWQARLKRFDLEGASGAWPSADAELTYKTAEGAQPVWEAKAAYLRLEDLAPWLAIVRGPEELAEFSGVKGEWRNLELRVVTGGPQLQYSVRGDFNGLGMPANGAGAGFSGLTGEMAGDERGGRAVLHEGPLGLELPGVLSSPQVTVESLEGEVEWKRLANAWQLHVPQFRWTLLTTHGGGRLDLTFPDDKRQPAAIDLNAKFGADDVTAAKPLMPLKWGPGLIEYLDRGILAGRAPQAELNIKGPLADFPFDKDKTGAWSLDIVAQDVLFAYQPDWPQLEHVNATLKFRGNSLLIEANAGQTAGNVLKQATARFDDLAIGELVVDGSVAGETARMYDFLRASPLREPLAALVGRTSGEGPSAVDIHLVIPVKHAEDTAWRGKVKLDGVQLRYHNLPEPIRNIRGELAFSKQGINADKLTAQMYEVPLTAKVKPQENGASLLTAAFELAIDPKGRGASGFIPAFVRPWLVGKCAWTGELVIGGGANAPPLTLRSDLEGVEIKLPEPVGKVSGLAAPIAVAVGEGADTPLAVSIDLQDRFAAALDFTPSRSGWNLRAGALRLGSGATPQVQGPGLVLTGTVSDLDVRTWLKAVTGESTGTGGGAPLKRADMNITRAGWGGFVVHNARYQWTGLKNGWDLAMSGEGAAGTVHYDNGPRPRMTARLEHFAAVYHEIPGDGTGPIDPSVEPLMDIIVRDARIGDARLGHVVFVTDEVDHGQSIRKLRAEGATLGLTADGEWRRASGKSAANVTFDVNSTDVAALLRSLGFAVNIEAKTAKFKGKLAWAPADAGLDPIQGTGSVHLEFEKGQLVAVDPGGAARVLGLLNFFALSRRLTFDVSDVVKKGLGYDRISGDFRLDQGDARTQNLRIDAPSMRMDITGRIGLAARDYDEALTVYPDYSSGVTLASLIFLGPVGGVLTLIGQELLKNPINRLTKISYHVTGDWDKPKIERMSTPKEAERPSGSPSQNP